MIARYIHLRRHPRVFLAMTGLHVPEFDELVRDLRPRYEQAEVARLSRVAAMACPRHRRKRAIGAGHPFALDGRDQVLLLMIWLRVYSTYVVLAYLFGVSEAAVSRLRARVLPVLEQAGLETMHEARARLERLAILAQARQVRPPRSRRQLDDLLREVPDLVVIIDSFEQRVQRPQGQDAVGKRHADAFYSGKKKQHTLKTQVALARPTGEILDVPESVPGPTSDIKLLEQSGTLQQVPDGVGVTCDLAYVGMDKLAATQAPAVYTATARRKPRGQPRPDEDVAYNTAFARERIDVEHGIGRLRRYEAITHTDRHHRRDHTPRTRAIAGLTNRQVRSRRRLRLGAPR